MVLFGRVELEEDGVRIALTIVDTPGFGDNIDNEFAYVLMILLLLILVHPKNSLLKPEISF